jgi:hypothetical protein
MANPITLSKFVQHGSHLDAKGSIVGLCSRILRRAQKKPAGVRARREDAYLFPPALGG